MGSRSTRSSLLRQSPQPRPRRLGNQVGPARPRRGLARSQYAIAHLRVRMRVEHRGADVRRALGVQGAVAGRSENAQRSPSDLVAPTSERLQRAGQRRGRRTDLDQRQARHVGDELAVLGLQHDRSKRPSPIAVTSAPSQAAGLVSAATALAVCSSTGIGLVSNIRAGSVPVGTSLPISQPPGSAWTRAPRSSSGTGSPLPRSRTTSEPGSLGSSRKPPIGAVTHRLQSPACSRKRPADKEFVNSDSPPSSKVQI